MSARPCLNGQEVVEAGSSIHELAQMSVAPFAHFYVNDKRTDNNPFTTETLRLTSQVSPTLDQIILACSKEYYFA